MDHVLDARERQEAAGVDSAVVAQNGDGATLMPRDRQRPIAEVAYPLDDSVEIRLGGIAAEEDEHAGAKFKVQGSRRTLHVAPCT